MDAKTPVTLLQEVLLKKGASPDYILLHNGVGTHEPLFVYEVKGLGKSAVGSGKSKREAKHAAAQELLNLINVSERQVDGVVQSPYAAVIKENAVGALQDFCTSNMISTPIYEQTRDEGLPHAKLFGVKCTVSSLTTQAEARTKKQAKQLAAQAMIVKLKECLKEENLGMFAQKEKKISVMTENEEKAVKKFEEVCKKEEVTQPQARPLGTPLDHYDHLFKQDLFLSSEAFNAIKGKRDSYFDSLDDPFTVFAEIMDQLDLKWDVSDVPVKLGVSGHMLCIQVPHLNHATFFGHGVDKNSAHRSACINALKWLAIMGC